MSVNTNCACTGGLGHCATGHYHGNFHTMIPVLAKEPCTQYFSGRREHNGDRLGGGGAEAVRAWQGASEFDDASFLVARLIEFMSRDSTRPVLAFLHFHNVHIPYVADDSWRARPQV